MIAELKNRVFACMLLCFLNPHAVLAHTEYFEAAIHAPGHIAHGYARLDMSDARKIVGEICVSVMRDGRSDKLADVTLQVQGAAQSQGEVELTFDRPEELGLAAGHYLLTREDAYSFNRDSVPSYAFKFDSDLHDVPGERAMDYGSYVGIDLTRINPNLRDARLLV